MAAGGSSAIGRLTALCATFLTCGRVVILTTYCSLHDFKQLVKTFFDSADNFFMPTEQVTVRLPDDLMRKLEAMADQETRSRANMIEVLLKEAIQARESPKKKP
jgi:hypothetical protein